MTTDAYMQFEEVMNLTSPLLLLLVPLAWLLLSGDLQAAEDEDESRAKACLALAVARQKCCPNPGPSTQPAHQGKACPCSPLCVCGCNAGLPCRCGGPRKDPGTPAGFQEGPVQFLTPRPFYGFPSSFGGVSCGPRG